MDLSKHIAVINDFPKQGVIFKDITPLFMNPDAFNSLLDELADKLQNRGATKLIAAEARGFMLGVPLALKMKLPFVPVRKTGKLPRRVNSVTYDLEYGTDSLSVHADDISAADRVIVFDDILATGGTADAMCRLVKMAGAEISCCAFLMELGFLKGREKIKCCPEVVSYIID